MVMAYNLEKCAVVPMIAISDDLRRHFFEHPHRNFYHESYDPVAKYFIEVQLPDGRLLWVIDYLPLFLGEIDGSLTREEKERYRTEDGVGREQLRAAAWRRAPRELAIAHKDSILSARAQASDPHIAAKYDWLMQYHNDALRRFFVDPPEEILIGTT